MQRIKREKLKELYDCACQPCLKEPGYCKGDPEKAKEWKCRQFFNGFFYVGK